MNTLHFLHTMGALFLLGVQKLIQLMHLNRLLFDTERRHYEIYE